MVEKKVIVTSEDAQAQGVEQWATYCAVLLDEDGNSVFEDFIVQLYLDTRVVACVYLRGDIYNPETGELRMVFQVPKEFTAGKYHMHLYWHAQMDPATLITYLEGDSPGITYTIVPSRHVNISDCVILHPQAPGQKTSFKATLLDEFGVALPEKFYLQIFSSSDVPVHIPISEFIGFTNGLHRQFYTTYRIDEGFVEVKVYFDEEEVLETDYVVHSRASFEDEYLGIGDGETTEFYTEYAPIVPDSLTVYVDKVKVTNYSVDYSMGKVTFITAPKKDVVITVNYTTEFGAIEFLTVPPTEGCCPGRSITVDYVAFTAGDFPLGGVYMSRKPEGVYDPATGELEFAFKVPEDFLGKIYPVWIGWGTQVWEDVCYLAGHSSTLPLVVTTDVRKVVVETDSEWLEFPQVYPGDETSYHAIIYDEKGESLPPELPTELLLNDTVVARAFLAPDVYNPVTKEVKLSFKVPEDITPGTYTVKLKWYEHVTGGELR